MAFKVEQYAQLVKGQFIIDDKKFLDNLSILQDGDYVLTLTRLRTDRSPEEWQKEFGAKLTEFCNELGYSRSDREKQIRPMIYADILPDVYSNPQHITIPIEEWNDKFTTKILTAAGWRAFMHALGDWMYTNYEGYIM